MACLAARAHSGGYVASADVFLLLFKLIYVATRRVYI